MGISEREYQEMLRRNGGPDGIAVINDPRRTVGQPRASVSGITTTAPVPTEHEEQVALFQWAEANEGTMPELRNLVAFPNGGYRPMATAAMLREEGVKAGLPDLALFCQRGGKGAIFIELKRRDHSNHATDAQRDWIERLRAAGYMAVVCYGAQEAIDVIASYLAQE